jgi:hypothetical protein
MGRIPYRNLLELRIFPRAPMRIAAANCAYSIPLNRLLRKVWMAGCHNDVALSGTGMMEELHTDSIDGGHEGQLWARSRARERAYSNTPTRTLTGSDLGLC